MKKQALLLACLFAFLALPAQAAMIVNDHFDGDGLDSSWNVRMELGATGWDYTLANSYITPDQISTSSSGVWGKVILSQQINPIDDFIAEFEFNWSEPNANTIQAFGLGLRDSDNNLVSSLYNRDSWSPGPAKICVDYGLSSNTNHGDLPLTGSATASMVRKDGIISYYWNGNLLASKQLLDYATTLELTFLYHPWYGQSLMGEMSVDYVTLEGDPVDLSATPEPGTMMLLGSALGLGAWWQRRRKRRA